MENYDLNKEKINYFFLKGHSVLLRDGVLLPRLATPVCTADSAPAQAIET